MLTVHINIIDLPCNRQGNRSLKISYHWLSARKFQNTALWDVGYSDKLHCIFSHLLMPHIFASSNQKAWAFLQGKQQITFTFFIPKQTSSSYLRGVKSEIPAGQDITFIKISTRFLWSGCLNSKVSCNSLNYVICIWQKLIPFIKY